MASLQVRGWVVVGGNRHVDLVVDVVQDGRRLKSLTATGATGCAGVRKSVKFELAATPFTMQLSGVQANSIGIAISRE